MMRNEKRLNQPTPEGSPDYTPHAQSSVEKDAYRDGDRPGIHPLKADSETPHDQAVEKVGADGIIANSENYNQTKGEGKMTTISRKERVEIGKIKAKAITELKRRGMEAKRLFLWMDGEAIEGKAGPEAPGVLIERKGGRFVSRLFIHL